ncbi:MAG: heme o synthase [Actinomycetota bacterium]|jgi:protoheme IX farnesyltransferase
MTLALTATPSVKDVVKGYIALMKLRVVELLLVTTIPPMIVAYRGIPSIGSMVATLFGGTLAAGGANAMNMVYDRDIDSVMKRTQRRPLVTGLISPRDATIFAIGLEFLAYVVLQHWDNQLAGLLALSGTFYYVIIYTIWLKRRSKQNIVIGGAAGAVPVLVGWAAITNNLSLAPVLLFLVIFIWTPPHFWALAVRYRDDYAAANVPMLPVVASLRRTTLEIMVYSVIMWALTILIGPSAGLGWIYAISATVLGFLFTFYAYRLYVDAHNDKADVKDAMKLFHFSITYLTTLFVAMAVDVLVRYH